MPRLLAMTTAACLTLAGGAAQAASCPRAPDPELWTTYRARFVTPEGRVVDTGNGGVSHSEGQGYGMLLAVAFGDQPSFATMWRWTRRNLAVRDDRLLAWRWDPEQPDEPVADPNSATDGDLLVAWALARAADRWGEPMHRDEAAAILSDVLRLAVRDVGGRTVLLPGPAGFVQDDDAAAAVTVNLSYWVFPALAEFAAAQPAAAAWDAVADSGLALLAEARFGAWGLPPDWLTLAPNAAARPADGFAPEFGFNAARIPLYLVWAGRTSPELLRPYVAFWSHARSGPPPATVDLVSDEPADYAASRGVRAIAALSRHALDPSRPLALPRLGAEDDYYSATLLLLAHLACSEWKHS
jgi:endoglucanase